MKIKIFVLIFILTSLTNLFADYISDGDYAFSNSDYLKAYNYYRKAENDYVDKKIVYYKLAQLCEITKNYELAVFYNIKYAQELNNNDLIDNIIENIFELNYKKSLNHKPVTKLQHNINTDNNQKNLNKLKFKTQRYDFNSAFKTQNQNYTVDRPVAVAGVRGADELDIKNETVNNLKVNLKYYNFDDNILKQFIKQGYLNNFTSKNKGKFHITEFVVSKEDEIKQGEQTAQILINNFKQNNKYCEPEKLKKYPVLFKNKNHSNKTIHKNRIYYLNLILNTIAKNTERPDLKYKIDIFYDNNINAFTTSSGYIFISEKFFNVLDNEDQLAAIIAHEISHITLRHHGKSETQKELTGLLFSELLEDKKEDVKKAVDTVNKTLIKNSFSRTEEYQADKKAADYLIKLGYNPFSLISVLEKFIQISRIENKLVGSFLNNHPNPEKRISKLKDYLKKYDKRFFFDTGFYKRKNRFLSFTDFDYSIKYEPETKKIKNKTDNNDIPDVKNILKELF